MHAGGPGVGGAGAHPAIGWLKACVDPRRATAESLRDYLAVYNGDGKRAGSTTNNMMCAIRYFYRHVVHRDIAESLKHAATGTHLPKVLPQEQMMRLVTILPNLKHRALLALGYGGGLRIHEAVQVRVADLDFERYMIRVRGKGDKDRYTLFSRQAAEIVREYMLVDKPRGYLFKGQKPGTHLCTGSAGKVFHRALEKAGIDLKAGFHTLRHSFGTHLIHSGTTTRAVQMLMGHKHVNTTEIYTHVSPDSLRDIQSPLDRKPQKPGHDSHNIQENNDLQSR